MAFELPPLPFDKTALSPVLSAESFDYHHGKHHKAYVDKVNGWIGEKSLAGKSLLEVIELAKSTGDKGLFNNAAQIWNHSFFWQCLAPIGSTRPSGTLKTAIEDNFGSLEALQDALASAGAGHFGSGWVWLVLDKGALKVMSFHDADTPVAHGLDPLLTIDVWEHAYYIDHRNARPNYLEATVRDTINWDFVSQNLDGRGATRADQSQ